MMMNVCIVSHVLLYLISGILHDCTLSAHNRLLQGGSDQDAVVLCSHAFDREWEPFFISNSLLTVLKRV